MANESIRITDARLRDSLLDLETLAELSEGLQTPYAKSIRAELNSLREESRRRARGIRPSLFL